MAEGLYISVLVYLMLQFAYHFFFKIYSLIPSYERLSQSDVNTVMEFCDYAESMQTRVNSHV